jgi:hypothetical protein
MLVLDFYLLYYLKRVSNNSLLNPKGVIMESVGSKLGYYPKCPHCKSDEGFDVTCCPHTMGRVAFMNLLVARTVKF